MGTNLPGGVLAALKPYKYRWFVEQAATDDVRLLVLPEASLQGFLFHLDHCFDPEESEYHWENAEPVPGPSTELIADMATKDEMYISFGLFERVDHADTPCCITARCRPALGVVLLALD